MQGPVHLYLNRWRRGERAEERRSERKRREGKEGERERGESREGVEGERESEHYWSVFSSLFGARNSLLLNLFSSLGCGVPPT